MGPVSIAQGANGASQTVEAFNTGDGSLSLTLSTSASWIGATVGAQRACTSRAGVCTPLQFALNTSGLPAGTSTGIVTVSDPDAVDAPQTITVTVQMGGGVPSRIDLYVVPGGTGEMTFSTNSQLTTSTRTNDGGSWLSLSMDGGGSFRFAIPYRVRVTSSPQQAYGDYSGTITTSGSSLAAENRSVPVTMKVTPNPIAKPSSERLSFRLAQGAPAVTSAVALTNTGQGILTVVAVTSTGGSWLTAEAYPGGAALKIDAGTMAPGSYSGSVKIASNAANGDITVPVDFQVVAKGAPLIRYQGVVDNGTFGAGDPVTQGDVMVVLGEQLSFDPLTVGQAPPLAKTVGGAKILVNGLEAPMYYSSYGQLAFQMPYETSVGTAEVQVERDGQRSNKVTVEVAKRAPRLLLVGVGSYGAIMNQDNSIPMPVGSFPGVFTRPAHPGEALTIYAIGLGATSPQPATGQPAPLDEPLARVLTTPVVNFGAGIGSVQVTPFFVGLTPTYAGLYQLNVTIPPDAPKGLTYVSLVFPDSVSNAVQIVIE